MDLNTIIESILSEGLHPIRAKGWIEEPEAKTMRFDGDLAGFIVAAKLLSSKVVFVFKSELLEEDFFYETGDEEIVLDEGQDEGAVGEVALDDVVPALREYKRYIGMDSSFRLVVLTPNVELSFYVYPEWWAQFEQLRDEAVAKVEESRESIMEQIEDARKKRSKELINQLNQLITDSAFTELSTQTAMKEYALEKIPGLEEMDEHVLRKEIQTLNAKIKAKGLHRRK
jgi:hypothetical protein